MRVVIFLFILLPVSHLNAQDRNTITWDMPGASFLYGPDQSPTLISAAGIHKEDIYQYTLRGKKIKDSAWLKTIFYDSAGNKTAELVRGHKADTILHNFYYGDNNQLTKESYSCACPKQSTVVTEYKQEAGRPAARVIADKDTAEWRENQLYYDDRHRLIMRYQKQAYRDPIYEKYQYDENNRLIHRDVLNPAGEVSSSYDIVYDDVARSRITSKNINGLAYPMDKEYFNEKMQLVKESFSISSMTLEYNDDGTLKEIKKNAFDLTRFFYNKP